MKIIVTVILLAIGKSDSTHHKNLTYVNILSKSAIRVIEEVKSESHLTCISITTSNSQESSRQHNDLINDIAVGIPNSISIISSDDRNRTFHVGLFKEQKRFNIFVVDGLHGFR